MHKSLPTIPFTQEAYQKLQTQQQQLLTEQQELLVRLQAAREMGDLSENGAYKYAKLELGNVRRLLRQVNHQLRFGKVVTKSTDTCTVTFGHTVTIELNGKELEFMLVSEYESDPTQQKLSTKSPVGKAVLGKKVGEEVKVELPKGAVIYTLTKIS